MTTTVFNPPILQGVQDFLAEHPDMWVLYVQKGDFRNGGGTIATDLIVAQATTRYEILSAQQREDIAQQREDFGYSGSFSFQHGKNAPWGVSPAARLFDYED